MPQYHINPRRAVKDGCEEIREGLICRKSCYILFGRACSVSVRAPDLARVIGGKQEMTILQIREEGENRSSSRTSGATDRMMCKGRKGCANLWDALHAQYLNIVSHIFSDIIKHME